MKRMIFKNNTYLLLLAVICGACSANGEFPGLEYAPQMYHSTAYEPLSQITDTEEGAWVSSLEDGVGEFYNSNPRNPHGMTMREPAANTVRRNPGDYLPYRIPKDSIELASRVLTNPLEENSDEVLQAGQALYASYCYPCHGGAGKGDGPVAAVYLGVPAYNVGRYANLTEGHIFHTITYGRGRMNAHGSQIDIEDRWKIVRYVQQLQKQE
ncbi:c-type cytochrome [Catalinimonas niigatensis]|uniref:c-type cytochrome n=1 Tax=Catalinimonas niigatensis TaxID=1397264 RepID=UPI002AA2B6CA|nr:cytochrome c [Catalinimonas niigatensis]WPP51515.1 cytochrome c [Catalinimonas niigatensis]